KNKGAPARLRSEFSPRSPKPSISHVLWGLFAVAGDPAGDGSHAPRSGGTPPPGPGAGARKLAPVLGSFDGREPSRASDPGRGWPSEGSRGRVREGWAGGRGGSGRGGLTPKGRDVGDNTPKPSPGVRRCPPNLSAYWG